MKDITMFLIFNAVSIICSLGAVLLAYEGVEGWGWLLVVAVISQATRMVSPGSKP